MDKQQWLDELHSQLRRQALPLDYVERLTLELSDHLIDLMEDGMGMDASSSSSTSQSTATRWRTNAPGHLGQPAEIAQAAGTEFRRRHFSSRHPVLMFVLLPVIALPLLWTLSLLGVISAGNVLEWWNPVYAETGPPQWMMNSLPLVLLAVLSLPVALCAYVFTRLATRAAVGWKWTLGTCCLLAVLGSLAISEVGVPTQPSQRGKHGSLMVGFSMSKSPRPSQVFQFALPLAICTWAIWRQSPGGKRLAA